MVMNKDGGIFFIKDVAQSQKVFEENSKLIQKKRCYENMLHLMLDTSLPKDSPNLLIAYGAKESAQAGIFVRHAFLYDESTGMVVDPTIPEQRETDEHYIIAATFGLHEYLDAILYGGKTTDFWDNKVFRKHLQEMERWALAQSLAIIG